MITVVGGALVAAMVYHLNQRAARRERRAKAFADALNAIEDYAEMPYRIRRRCPGAEVRQQLTVEFCRIKSRIRFHEAWLRIEAPEVVDAYENFERTARQQSGPNASHAWTLPPIEDDAGMNLGCGYPRDQIDRARDECVAAMLRSLG
ncbi:hypothetical protein [Cryptosporangium sp. NPDC048952]|uniref:hypothetical protein n=1 Tax=Cryptosporangium sp. NPDC048952 TaxID=3363961 RepID=UPI003712C391